MLSQREPLLLPLAGVIAGILVADWARFATLELCLAGGAFVLLWVFCASKAKRIASLPAFLLFTAAGIAISQGHEKRSVPELDAADDEVLVVSGCIVDPPSLATISARFVLELEPGARIRVSLTAKDGETLPDLRYGQMVEVEAKIRKPRNFGNPGSFDYANYLRRKDVYWTGSARGVDKLHRLPGSCGEKFEAFWQALRRASLDRLSRLFPNDPYTVAMMAGMLVGDDAAIQRSWTETFRRTGTYHALVISGLHITVISGTALLILRWCWVPILLRMLMAGTLAWSYAFLAGMQPPVSRAAGGFTLFLIAGFLFRKAQLMNLLAAVALVFLVWDPSQLYDASFQLSFLAVAAIAGLAVPILDRTSGVLRAAVRSFEETRRDALAPASVAMVKVELRLLAETLSLCTHINKKYCSAALGKLMLACAAIYDSVMVSLAVQLALLLPSIVYFHRLPITSVSANVVAVPMLSTAVPFGLLAIVTEWHWPAAIADALFRVSRFVVQWHAHFEPDWRVPQAPLWLSALFVLVLLLAAFRVVTHARLRMLVKVSLALCVGLILWHPFAALLQTKSLEVTLIDVGQGDAILVVLPDGQTLLVDAGGIPTFDSRLKPQLEIGEDVVSSYLWTRGFKQLDYVALTHGHDDHALGTLAVLENFHPKELWTGAQPAKGIWIQVEAKAKALGIRVVKKQRGDRTSTAGVNIETLAPSTLYQSSQAAKNNDSLVLLLSYGKHKFLLTGDAERQVETDLVDSGSVGRVDVLKVGHHGSKSSSTPDFLERVRPAFALISAGKYNSYRHPHPEVIERLAEAHTRVLRTDRDGLITVSSDGKHLSVSTNTQDGASGQLRSPFSPE